MKRIEIQRNNEDGSVREHGVFIYGDGLMVRRAGLWLYDTHYFQVSNIQYWATGKYGESTMHVYYLEID